MHSLKYWDYTEQARPQPTPAARAGEPKAGSQACTATQLNKYSLSRGSSTHCPDSCSDLVPAGPAPVSDQVALLRSVALHQERKWALVIFRVPVSATFASGVVWRARFGTKILTDASPAPSAVGGSWVNGLGSKAVRPLAACDCRVPAESIRRCTVHKAAPALWAVQQQLFLHRAGGIV